MTKRFTYIKNNSITQYQSLPIQEIGKGKALHCQGVVDKLNKLSDENEQLKASLYAEKTNTAEVINEYAKQFKRHSSQFSFMIDLAEDLGIDVNKLEALDD